MLALCEALHFVCFLRVVSGVKRQLGSAHITKVEAETQWLESLVQSHTVELGFQSRSMGL